MANANGNGAYHGPDWENLTRSDANLLTRAIKNNWIIPDEAWQDVPQALLNLVKDGGDKAKIAAAKTLNQMAAYNARGEPKHVEHDHRHLHAVVEQRRRLAGIAQHVGIDPVSIGLPAAESERDSTPTDGADGQDAKD